MVSKRFFFWVCLIGLCAPNLSYSQAVKVLPLSPEKLTGTWLGSSELKQPGVDMNTSGEKTFISSSKLEDRMTTSIVLKHHSPVPVVLGISLESDWKLIRSGSYLCETLTGFSVSLVSKPDDNALPGILVGQLMEQMQNGFKAQVSAKKANCNEIELSAPNVFALKDGQSGLITQFKRVK